MFSQNFIDFWFALAAAMFYVIRFCYRVCMTIIVIVSYVIHLIIYHLMNAIILAGVLDKICDILNIDFLDTAFRSAIALYTIIHNLLARLQAILVTAVEAHGPTIHLLLLNTYAYSVHSTKILLPYSTSSCKGMLSILSAIIITYYDTPLGRLCRAVYAFASETASTAFRSTNDEARNHPILFTIFCIISTICAYLQYCYTHDHEFRGFIYLAWQKHIRYRNRTLSQHPHTCFSFARSLLPLSIRPIYEDDLVMDRSRSVKPHLRRKISDQYASNADIDDAALRESMKNAALPYHLQRCTHDRHRGLYSLDNDPQLITHIRRHSPHVCPPKPDAKGYLDFKAACKRDVEVFPEWRDFYEICIGSMKGGVKRWRWDVEGVEVEKRERERLEERQEKRRQVLDKVEKGAVVVQLD